MKKIIRLTESDLTRIVKRVIKETTTKKSLKLKLYGPEGNFITNLDCSNMSLRGDLIDFDFKVAGGGIDYVYGATKSHGYPSNQYGQIIKGAVMIESGSGILECNALPMRTLEINLPDGKKASYAGKLSKKGMALVNSTFCSAYASTDTKQDDLDMGGDYA
jgi:hypothetical protein